MWEVSKELVDPYIQSCKESVASQKAFNSFRRDERLHPIFEHVSYEEGLLYLSEIKNQEDSISDFVYKAKENDLIGNPALYDYPDIGFISPTTLRYLKNIYDIGAIFAETNLKIENIVEIGGGYGGLCRMINCIFPLKQYLLVDFKEVNELSKKYLQYYYGECKGIAWITPEEIVEIDNIDLCVSNYCFSECDRQTQQTYYTKVIKNSKSFYITYNNISDRNMSAKEFEELASKDFFITKEEEVRDSHINYVMYGHNREYFSE